MSTYLELQQRVSNDHLNRSGFTDEIKRAIKTTIHKYELRRWKFQETSTTIAASAGQTFLTIPTNFISHDYLQLSYSGATTRLIETDLSSILEMRSGASNGVPTHYTIYAQKFELAVPPDSAYNCPLYYFKSLDDLSADADTNSWTGAGFEDLIVYGAAKLMWANVIRNQAEASICARLEAETLQTLDMAQVQYEGTCLRSTQF